jgi:hypothetical protein
MLEWLIEKYLDLFQSIKKIINPKGFFQNVTVSTSSSSFIVLKKNRR